MIGVVLKFENCKLKFSPCEIHCLGGCGPLQQAGYFSGSNFLRIEHKVYTKFREQVLVFV